MADANVYVALISNAHQRDLVVVARTTGKVWQRIKTQERQRLGAEGTGNPGNIARALGRSRHKPRGDAGIPVSCQLVIDEESCVFAAQELRNFQRTTERAVGAEMGVREFGRVLAGERKRLGVQRRVIQDEREVAVVLPAAPAGVSKRGAAVRAGCARSAAATRSSARKTTAAACESSAWPSGATARTSGTARPCGGDTARTAWPTKWRSTRTDRTAGTALSTAVLHPVILLRRIYTIADAAIHDHGLIGILVEVARGQIVFRARTFSW